MTTSSVTPTSTPAPMIDPPVAKKPAIKAWAALGAAFVIFQLYIYFKWITGPYFKPVPSGPTEVPMFMQVMVWIWIPGGILGMLWCLHRFLIKPWRRDGRPSRDGLFVVGWISVYWQDPLVSYFNNQFTWSAIVPNMGGWTAEVPGWQAPSSPGATMVEPVPFNLPLYVYALFTVCMLCNLIMRKTRERFPTIGTLGLIAVAWAFMALFDLFMEVSWGVMGFYSYPGARHDFSVFHGHYYQFPLYEPILWGACWAGVACLRYFRNDKGETLAERGLSRLTVSNRAKTVLRFLGVIAACNLCYLGYIIAFNLMGMKADDWPADIQQRSYLTAHLCGPDSGQLCPTSTTPIPKQGGVHFDQFGNLVVPPGVPAPATGSITQFVK